MKFPFQEQGFRYKRMYKLCQTLFNDVGSSHMNSVDVHYVGSGAKESTSDHKIMTELVTDQSSQDLRLPF